MKKTLENDPKFNYINAEIIYFIFMQISFIALIIIKRDILYYFINIMRA